MVGEYEKSLFSVVKLCFYKSRRFHICSTKTLQSITENSFGSELRCFDVAWVCNMKCTRMCPEARLQRSHMAERARKALDLRPSFF